MMRDHLDGTLSEATARVNGDWNGDVMAFDEVEKQTLSLADALTAGIVLQFPELVRADAGADVRASALHVGMRALQA